MEKADRQQEERHPGWRQLSDVLGRRQDLFEQTLFLEGFQFSSNIYVIRGEYLTIIDPGNDYTAFMDLFSMGVEPAAIKKVVATHGHYDHVMGAFEVLRSYPTILEAGGYELILHEAGPLELKKMAEGFGCRVREVAGGETLELSGLKWEVIHTPGHTIDGICLYHEPSRTLLTGDMVLPHAIGAPDPKAGGSLDHYMFALRALLKLDVENVLPGHGVPVADEGRRALEETYEAVIMKAIEVEDEAKVPWFEGASKLTQRGLFEESIFCLEKALAKDPDNAKALHLKALCLNDLGRCQEAIEVFDALFAQDPGNLSALVGKGYALLGLGNYEEAIERFEEVLKVDPEMEYAKVYKGMALYLSGRYQEAMDIEDFQREFVGRFKEELQKRSKPSSPS